MQPCITLMTNKQPCTLSLVQLNILSNSVNMGALWNKSAKTQQKENMTLLYF